MKLFLLGEKKNIIILNCENKSIKNYFIKNNFNKKNDFKNLLRYGKTFNSRVGVYKGKDFYHCSSKGIYKNKNIFLENKFYDPHSIINYKDGFAITNTGRNEIVDEKGKIIYKPNFLLKNNLKKDQIHLNDCIEVEGKLLLTCLSYKREWRQNFSQGAIWFENDFENKQKVYVPHTPKFYNERIYLLETGHGQLISFDKNLKDKKIEAEGLNGFLRGLVIKDDCAYICSSKFNKTRTFANIHNCEKLYCENGKIYKLNLKTKKLEIIYEKKGLNLFSIVECNEK